MTTRALAAWLVLSAGGWPGPLLAGADADDYAEPLRRAPAQLSLTSSQEQAVGIRVEQPLALLEALTHGRQLLVRADVPAHPLGSTVDRHAVVVIDGVNVSARVLGPLPRTDGPAQTAGWLLQLERTPGALGPGARIEVRLQA